MKAFFLSPRFMILICSLPVTLVLLRIADASDKTPQKTALTPIKTMEAGLFLDVKCQLGEGPFWHTEEKRLYWTDIDGCRVHRCDPETMKHEFVETKRRIGCLVPTSRGSLIMAGHHGLEELFFDSEKAVFLDDPESDKPDNRFNDGKCSPEGRFWFGSLNMKGKNRDGALYVMLSDKTVHKRLTGVGCSNGLAWSLDGKTLYYIDTSKKTVDAFDYDAETAGIANRRTLITFTGKDTAEEYTVGVPDGMTIDASGHLWIAHWGGHCVSCWNPETGRQLMKIHVPVSRVTSVAFGGENFETLYITTARSDMTREEEERQPHAGSVFFIKPGVAGLPITAFSPPQ